MSKLQLLNVFIIERLISAAVDIFGSSEKTLAEYQERLTTAAFEIFVVVEKTIAEVQGENDRLRELLLGHLVPQQLTLPEEEVSPKQQQHCEQEWSPSPGQEDPEPTQITEEQEELRTSQEEEQLQRLSKSTLFFSSE
ncbi:uncharacterized protein ACWYII_002348 isoform 5-T6 [Salvelinus alpinus]